MDDQESQRLERQKKGDRKTVVWLLAFVAGLFVLAVAVGGYEVGLNAGDDEEPGAVQEAQTTATETTEAPATETQAASQPAAGAGADLFVANCGSCHTLAAAGTSGTIGPNLDDLQPDEALVLTTIQNGAGGGLMPANLVTGAEAQQVAAYVAANAGH